MGLGEDTTGISCSNEKPATSFPGVSLQVISSQERFVFTSALESSEKLLPFGRAATNARALLASSS